MTSTTGTAMRLPRRSADYSRDVLDRPTSFSRDLYHQPSRGTSVLTLERSRRLTSSDLRERRSGTGTPSRDVERGVHRGRTLQVPRRRFQRQLGSHQVVSVRGRRVESPKADPTVVRRIVVMTLMLVAGLTIVMLLNGRTTEQSFAISQLSAANATADNEIETLHRNIVASQSAGDATEHAARKHMVIPAAPGLLEVQPDGRVDERIPASPGQTLRIVDVNREATPPAPDSRRRATDEVRDHLQPVPVERGGRAASPADPIRGGNHHHHHNDGGQAALPYTP